MLKVLKQVWAWISNIYAGLSMLSHILAVSGTVIAMILAWAAQWSPIQIFLGGLVGFALLIFILERIAFWRTRQSVDRNDNLGSLNYKDYICEAVEHLIKKVDDCDSDNCYPSARLELRKAAFAGNVKMYGKRELKKGFHSDLRTLIPQEYWDDQELNSLATSVVYSFHEHTQPETGEGFQRIGSNRERYWDIRVDMREIKSLWP